MVPRLLLLALVAVVGGLVAAWLADEPGGRTSQAVERAVPSQAEAPTPAAEAPTSTAEAEPQNVAPTATVPTVRRGRAPVVRSKPLRVPALVGLQEDVARAVVRRARLRALVRRLAVSKRSSDGIVTRQFPATGLRVSAGTPVTLFVAVYTGR